MTQYNILNVKLSNSPLNKLKSGINYGTEVTLNISLKLIGGSNDEINFQEKLLLTDTQISRFLKASADNSSANIKVSKTQFSKLIMSQLGGFFGPIANPFPGPFSQLDSIADSPIEFI